MSGECGRGLCSIPLICDPLPDKIAVLGREYPLMVDFRRWIIAVQLLEAELSPPLTAELLMKAVCPALSGEWRSLGADGYAEFFRGITFFALRGKRSGADGGARAGRGAEKERYFDFSADAELIYAAFYSEYGIDLAESSMHWWKFMALLASLPAESELMRVIALRRADPSGITDDRIRKQLRQAKARVRLR